MYEDGKRTSLDRRGAWARSPGLGSSWEIEADQGWPGCLVRPIERLGGDFNYDIGV